MAEGAGQCHLLCALWFDSSLQLSGGLLWVVLGLGSGVVLSVHSVVTHEGRKCLCRGYLQKM